MSNEGVELYSLKEFRNTDLGHVPELHREALQEIIREFTPR